MHRLVTFLGKPRLEQAAAGRRYVRTSYVFGEGEEPWTSPESSFFGLALLQWLTRRGQRLEGRAGGLVAVGRSCNG